MKQRTFSIEEADHGQRLDRFVAERAQVSRALAMRLIAQGDVRVDSRVGKKGMTLQVGQTVSVPPDTPDDLTTPPGPNPALPLSVLYADDAVVVVNKPTGQACHPLRAGEQNTVANAVVARFPACALAATPAREGGVCHRLDLHTSGALLFAQTPQAWRKLRDDFSAGLVKKEYLALVVGEPPHDEFELTLPLLPGRAGHPKVRVAATPDEIYAPQALDAHTSCTVLVRSCGYALLSVLAHTGRRHQIRAHLGHAGLPIVGDPVYGQPAEGGQLLHALRLSFVSPTDATVKRSVTAPVPPDRAALFAARLGRDQAAQAWEMVQNG